jgi:hypothetical protein
VNLIEGLGLWEGIACDLVQAVGTQRSAGSY